MAIISCSRIKSQALQGSFFLAITNHPLYSTCLVFNDTALASQPEGCKSSNLSCIEDLFFEQLKWRCKHDRYQPKIYIHSLLCLRYFGTYKTLPGYYPKQPGHILLTRYRFWRANAYHNSINITWKTSEFREIQRYQFLHQHLLQWPPSLPEDDSLWLKFISFCRIFLCFSVPKKVSSSKVGFAKLGQETRHHHQHAQVHTPLPQSPSDERPTFNMLLFSRFWHQLLSQSWIILRIFWTEGRPFLGYGGLNM